MLDKNDLAALDEFEEILDEIKQISDKFEELHNKVHLARLTTIVGKVLNFPQRRSDKHTFEGSRRELASLLTLRNQINEVREINNQLNENEEYEIGQLFQAKENCRFVKKERARYTYHVNSEGQTYHSLNRAVGVFEIVDYDGVNYTLVKNGYLVYADKDQLALFFEPALDWAQSNGPIFKIEFSLNGLVHERDTIVYPRELRQIQLYTKRRCPERFGGDWLFVRNCDYNSLAFDTSYDELFGMTGVAYFKGQPSEFTQSISPSIIKDIVFTFGNKFAENKDNPTDKFFIIGFSKKNNEEIFKYNGKISIFQKDHFPKDVFEGTPKGRVVHVIGITQIREKVEEAKI